jgi:hypothetical protein
MKSLLLVIVSFTVIVNLPVSSTAQKKDRGPSGAAFEVIKLDALAGKWDVDIQIFGDPGKGTRPHAVCEAIWTLGGHALRQEYTSTFMGQPLDVVQYLGYDEETKSFYELHMNSMHPGVLHNKGKMSKGGNRLEFIGRRADPTTHAFGSMRTVWTVLDRDHFIIEWFFRPNKRKEQPSVKLVFSRLK